MTDSAAVRSGEPPGYQSSRWPGASVDVGALIDASPWTTPQNVALVLVCFAVVCDGLDNLVFGLAIPAMSRGLLVAPKNFGIVFAFSFIGLSLGSIVAGRLGDRYGRKPVILVSLLLFGAFTALLATSHGIMGLTALRFVAGIGLGGAIPNVTALVAEWSPVRHRALAVTLTAISMTVGATAGAGLASLVIPAFGWQTLFVVAGALPLMVTPILFLFLPESPKYLAGSQRNRERLLRVLDRLRVAYPNQILITRAEEASEERVKARALFRSSLLRDTVAIWMTFFFAMAVGYMLLNWIPTMLSEAGFSIRQSSLGLLIYNCGGICGAIIAALMVRRFGSRVIIYFCIGGVAVAMVVGVGPNLAARGLAIVTLLFFTLGVFVTAATSSIFAIASHAYPTALRAVGVGSAVAVGRSGAIASSFVGAAVSGAAAGSRISFYIAAALLAGQAISMLIVRRHVPPVSLRPIAAS